MQAPGFWHSGGVLPRLLAPASWIVARSTARRMARPGWRAPVPVLCCGNAGVGGAGKTTLALDLGERLIRRGAKVAFLTRGYGGRVRGTVLAGPKNAAAEVGDEALLLAAIAPTYVGADRAAAAKIAVAAGATMLIMDDGLQNPGLAKSMSLLVVDGAVGFGNGRVRPARCASRWKLRPSDAGRPS
jgi:tetraacyldisaccharide 4'-kinase